MFILLSTLALDFGFYIIFSIKILIGSRLTGAQGYRVQGMEIARSRRHLPGRIWTRGTYRGAGPDLHGELRGSPRRTVSGSLHIADPFRIFLVLWNVLVVPTEDMFMVS